MHVSQLDFGNVGYDILRLFNYSSGSSLRVFPIKYFTLDEATELTLIVNRLAPMPTTEVLDEVEQRVRDNYSSTEFQRSADGLSTSFVSGRGVRVRVVDPVATKLGNPNFLRIENIVLGESYGGLREVYNILLRNIPGFNVDRSGISYSMNFREHVLKTYRISSCVDLVEHLLDLDTSGYRCPSQYMRDVSFLVDWFLRHPTLGTSSFHFSKDKVYIGPDDYFGSPLFKRIVENIQERYPTKTFRHGPRDENLAMATAFNGWRSSGDFATYSQLEKDSENIKSNYLLKEKLDNIGFPGNFLEASHNSEEFWETFKNSVNGDFMFYVLSSSEDTLANDIKKYRDSTLALS